MPDQLTKRNTTQAPVPAANHPVPTRSATVAPASTPTRPGAATATTRSSASPEQAKAVPAPSLLEAAQPPINRPGQETGEGAGQLKGQNTSLMIGRLSDKNNGAGNNHAAGTKGGQDDAALLKGLDTHSAQKEPPAPASWIVRLLEIAEQRGEAGRNLLAETIASQVSQEWAKSTATRLGELPLATAAQPDHSVATKAAPVPGNVGQKSQLAQPLTATANRTAQMQLEVPLWLETDQTQPQSKPSSQHQNTPKQIEQSDLAERQALAQRAARILKATGLQTVTPTGRWLNIQFYQLREATRKLTNGWEPEEIRDWLELRGDQPLWRAIVRVYRSPHLVGPAALKTAGQQNAAALHVVMALWIEAREAAENSTQRPTAHNGRY